MFSVIIATFNEELTIERTLRSVLDQSDLVDKIIIKDAGSSDATVQRASRWLRVDDLIISSFDKGIYYAWNEALEQVESEWVIFLGSGDILTQDSLAVYRDYLVSQNEELEFVSSRIEKFDLRGRSLGICYGPWTWNSFRRYMCTSHVGAVHSIGLFKRSGSFNTDYKICADYELLLRQGNKLKAGFVDRVQARMLSGGISDSVQALKETARIQKKIRTSSFQIIMLDFLIAYLKLCTRKFIHSA